MNSNRLVDHAGNEYWVDEDSEFHRTDGPAVIYKDGTQHWYIKGNRHREDGPAVIEGDGSKHWFINDKRHRIDGPALMLSDGRKKWFLFDQQISDSERFRQLAKLSHEDMTVLVLKYGSFP